MSDGLGYALLIGTIWILTSSVFSTYANGLFLRTFNDAMAPHWPRLQTAHTFFRFALSSCIGLTYSAANGAALLARLPHLVGHLVLPAMLLLVANLLNSMSMLSSGVTCAYVVKSLIPFFTVMVSRIRGQRFETVVYWSLCPVCAGVCVASVTDLDVSVAGFAFALGSAISQTLLNITSKERIKQLQLSGMEAFSVMTTTCAVLSAPLFAVSCTMNDGFLDRWTLLRDVDMESVASVNSKGFSAIQVVVFAVLAYYVEYTLNFLFVVLCTPLAFSLCDILRRLGTICCGAVLFAKPFTLLNAGGVLTSLLGVLLYSYFVTQQTGTYVGPAKSSGGSPDDFASTPMHADAKTMSTHEWASHYGVIKASRSESNPADGMAVLPLVTRSRGGRLSWTSAGLIAGDSPLSISPSALYAGGSVFPRRLARQQSEGVGSLRPVVDETIFPRHITC